MNLRANRPIMARLRRVWYTCFFGFTPALASRIGVWNILGTERGSAHVEQLEASHPYLSAIGSPPLRFQEAVVFSPALPPDSPSTTPEPAASKPAGSPSTPTIALTSTAPKGKQVPDTSTLSAGPRPADAVEPQIIPDDLRPKVRPEEFLPFFQLPGSGAQGVSTPSVPGTLAPSSATYRKE